MPTTAEIYAAETPEARAAAATAWANTLALKDLVRARAHGGPTVPKNARA